MSGFFQHGISNVHVACVSASFLFTLDNLVWMDHISCIHFPPDGHLRCFCLSPVVSSCAMTAHAQVSMWHMFNFS